METPDDATRRQLNVSSTSAAVTMETASQMEHPVTLLVSNESAADTADTADASMSLSSTAEATAASVPSTFASTSPSITSTTAGVITTSTDHPAVSSVPERAWERRLRSKQSMATVSSHSSSSTMTTAGPSHLLAFYSSTTPGAFRVAGISGEVDNHHHDNDGVVAVVQEEQSWRSSTTLEEVTIGEAGAFIPVQAELAPEELLLLSPPPVDTTPPLPLRPFDNDTMTVVPDEANMEEVAASYNGQRHVGEEDAPEMVLSVRVIKDDDDDDGNGEQQRRSFLIRYWWWLVGGGILLVLVAIIIVVVAVVSASSSNSTTNNNNNNTPSSSLAPTVAPTVQAAVVAGVPTTFTLRGDTLTGLPLLPTLKSETNSLFGSSVAMDATGTILAVGASEYTPRNQTRLLRRVGLVQVYQYNETLSPPQWTVRGSAIEGQDDQDYVGRSVALSSDGSRLAVGAFGYNNQDGVVRVYQYQTQNSSWMQVGNDLEGSSKDQVGWGTMAFSKDGMILAYGGLASNINATCQASGVVRVVTYDASRNVWRRRGNDLIGKACQDQFGISVAMTQDGTMVAVGARYYNGPNGELPYAGLVQVFQYESTTASWQQVGQDIVGKQSGDRMGRAVSLSATGRTLCVGASQAEANGTFVPGYAQVYTLQQQDGSSGGGGGGMLWIPQGPTLFGNHTGDYFGGSVDLSSDGKALIVCARQSSHSVDVYRGYCQLYALASGNHNNKPRWKTVGASLQGQATYDQFGGSVALSNNGNLIAVGAAQDTDNQTLQQGYVQVYAAQQTV